MVKPVGGCSVNISKGCVSDSNLGATGDVSSPNAVTKQIKQQRLICPQSRH